MKLAKYLLCNVYLPCVGTCDRLLICEDLFESLRSWYASYPNCECVIAGDFNVDLNKCVSKTDTNPPFAFQIAFPRGIDFAGFLQGGTKSRDLQSEISNLESNQLQC